MQQLLEMIQQMSTQLNDVTEKLNASEQREKTITEKLNASEQRKDAISQDIAQIKTKMQVYDLYLQTLNENNDNMKRGVNNHV